MKTGVNAYKILLFTFIYSTFSLLFCQKQTPDLPAKLVDLKKLPYKLEIKEEKHKTPQHKYKVVDLNCDGTSEILVISPHDAENKGIMITISDLSLTNAFEQIDFKGKIFVECCNLNIYFSQESRYKLA